jgi:hypothetical protein
MIKLRHLTTDFYKKKRDRISISLLSNFMKTLVPQKEINFNQ